MKVYIALNELESLFFAYDRMDKINHKEVADLRISHYNSSQFAVRSNLVCPFSCEVMSHD